MGACNNRSEDLELNMTRKIIKKRMNKKGVFYTIIAVTLLLAVIFASSATYQFKYREQRAVIETRVNTMNNFIDDLGEDMEKGVRVAGYRSVLGIINYMLDSLDYLDDTETRFEELFYDGTIYGNSSFVMFNNTYTNWTQKMQVQANLIGLDVTFTTDYFNVEQTGPWDITVTKNVSVVVTDLRDVAMWRKTYHVQSVISIDGFEDPIYALETSHAATKIINRTVYDDNYVTGNDTTNLQLHMNNTYYTEFEGAPNFFMRLEGDLTPNEFGIESLVNKEEIGLYHSCPEGTSNVDYLYWNCSSQYAWVIDGMPSWFYLDNLTAGGEGRLEKYEVDGLI